MRTVGCLVLPLFLMICSVSGGAGAWAQEAETPVFSGPQPGEPLPKLPVRVLFREGEAAGTLTDLAAVTPETPHHLIVFVHQLTRPSIGLVRPLLQYAATRRDDGLQPALIFLGEDATGLEQRVTRARHALPPKVPVAISLDGVEGPGAYGLNRNVTLTILVASEGEVKANFAIIDPNIPVALPKTLKAVCEVVGGEPPPLERLLRQGNMRMQRRTAAGRNPRRAPEKAETEPKRGDDS